jgi:hypothetical protein
MLWSKHFYQYVMRDWLQVIRRRRLLAVKGTAPSWPACSKRLLLNLTWWVNRKDSEGGNVSHEVWTSELEVLALESAALAAYG